MKRKALPEQNAPPPEVATWATLTEMHPKRAFFFSIDYKELQTSSSHLKNCAVDNCGRVRWILCPFPFLQQPVLFLVCLVNISLMSRLGLFPFLSTWFFLFLSLRFVSSFNSCLQSFLSFTFTCLESHSSLLAWLHLFFNLVKAQI